MSPKQYTKDVRKLLDALPKAKTEQEMLKLVIQIKWATEILYEQTKKRRDKARMAFDRKTQIIKKALKQFLTSLDKIYSKHDELGDTAVREKMFDAVRDGFIKPESAYVLPERFGMFSEKGNSMVRAAIQTFLSHPQVISARKNLKTAAERLNAFQDSDVETSEGNNFFEYFGCRGGIDA